jgi:hypothetical protein
MWKGDDTMADARNDRTPVQDPPIPAATGGAQSGPLIASADRELSDADLDKVSGGTKINDSIRVKKPWPFV